MDEDERVITQLGLLLTQVRYARMALDGIENATSRYAGLSLTIAGASGTPWAPLPWSTARSRCTWSTLAT